MPRATPLELSRLGDESGFSIYLKGDPMITVYHNMRNIRRYRLYGGYLIPLAIERTRIGAGHYTWWENL